MSRYLGIYQNLAAVQSALNNEELIKPYVALYENNNTTSIDYNTKIVSCTFTINSTISNTTIIINGVERSSFTTAKGTSIIWSVSKNGYLMQMGTYILNTDHTETITLTAAPNYANTYFTIRSLEDSTISISRQYYNDNNSELWYKLNNGSWTQIEYEYEADPISINTNAYDTIQLKGTGFDNGYKYCNLAHGLFISSTGYHEVYGNILSLLYADNFAGQEDEPIDDYQFATLFGEVIDFGNEWDADIYLISAENLILPNIVSDGCYYGMFRNCINLTKAPVLPASILVSKENPYGYSSEFIGCYEDMFIGCSNLNYIKCLATDISATECLNNWVNGVAASGTFIKATSMNNFVTGVNGIPSGWTIQNAS